MGEEPLTIAALARFHREILLPDMERMVANAVGGLRTEFAGHFDEIYKRFDRLEIEYHAIVLDAAGLGCLAHAFVGA